MPPTANSKPLRPYQIECTDAVMAARKRSLNRVLIVMPTGSGKTRCVSDIVRRIMQEDRRPALWLAHQEELLGQAAGALRAAMPWAMVDIEQADHRARGTAHVICASMQTLGYKGSKRLQWLADMGPSVIVIDEAHRGVLGGGYEAICERFGAFDQPQPRTFTIGCTATAARLDNKPLTGPHGEAVFQEQVFEYKLLDAIKDGYIVPIRGYRVETDIDLSQIKKIGGDYNQAELAKAVNVEARTLAAIKHWREVAENRPTAVFCVDRAHAEAVARTWRDAGYRATAVDGQMRDKSDRIRFWKAGDVQITCSCNLLLEGFDYPAISCVVMLRPTESWVLYSQAIGRGVRLAPGKQDLTVLDVVDNAGKHTLGKPPKSMSLPRVVGMPGELDLAGGDLMGAKTLFDAAELKGVHVETGKTTTVKELKTRLASVDLMGGAEYAPEVLAGSRLAWIKIGQGDIAYYVLHAGKGPGGGERIMRLSPNALGEWHLEWNASDGQHHVYACGYGDAAPFGPADARVMWAWGNAMNLMLRESEWKKAGDPATDKQVEFLRREGLTDHQIAELDKGKAAQIIAAALAKRKSIPGTGGRTAAYARFSRATKNLTGGTNTR